MQKKHKRIRVVYDIVLTEYDRGWFIFLGSIKLLIPLSHEWHQFPCNDDPTKRKHGIAFNGHNKILGYNDWYWKQTSGFTSRTLNSWKSRGLPWFYYGLVYPSSQPQRKKATTTRASYLATSGEKRDVENRWMIPCDNHIHVSFKELVLSRFFWWQYPPVKLT